MSSWIVNYVYLNVKIFSVVWHFHYFTCVLQTYLSLETLYDFDFAVL